MPDLELPFNRRPTTQDISWLLDLHRNKQLDLNPPYQRRSVWTRKDRYFFLDTIFRGFPSPAVFLHKTIAEDGNATYHVVDGKQRIETILAFAVEGRLRVAGNFGDVRLNGKNWAQLEGEPSLRQSFWNYQLIVEMVNFGDASVINEVFDRLNRNSRKLTRQELRHAKYDGWLMTLIEEEAKKPEWKALGVATPGREKRMADSQAISELILVVLEGNFHGFDQDALDGLYAKYDDVSPESGEPESLGAFGSEDAFTEAFQAVKDYLAAMDANGGVVSTHAKTLGNLYTLWSVVTLRRPELPPAAETASRYAAFMRDVERVRVAVDLEALLRDDPSPMLRQALSYARNLRGANTDVGPRAARFDALLIALTNAA